jgi:hypothetical protein
MGSHPTLAQQELAAEALELHPDDWTHPHAVAHLATEHPQVRTWPDGNLDLAHQLDHRDWIHDHHHRTAERTAEQAFDRLNPSASPPSAPTASATTTSSSARPPWPSGSGWPSTTAARTTPTRSSGSPAGLPSRRGHPGRPHPAHPHPSRPRASRTRTLTASSTRCR